MQGEAEHGILIQVDQIGPCPEARSSGCWGCRGGQPGGEVGGGLGGKGANGSGVSHSSERLEIRDGGGG